MIALFTLGQTITNWQNLRVHRTSYIHSKRVNWKHRVLSNGHLSINITLTHMHTKSLWFSFKSCEMDYWLQIENCVTSSLCTFKCVADHIVRTIWEWHASKSFHFVFSKNAWTINEKKDDNYKFIKCSRQSPIEMGVHKISKMAHIRMEIGRWRWSTYYYDYLSKCI